MHFLWAWLLHLLVAGVKEIHASSKAGKRATRAVAGAGGDEERGGKSREGKLKYQQSYLSLFTCCQANSTPSVAPTHPSLSWRLSRVVPLSQKMTNIPQIFFFLSFNRRKRSKSKEGGGGGGGGGRMKWRRRGGGEVRPLLLSDSAQTAVISKRDIQVWTCRICGFFGTGSLVGFCLQHRVFISHFTACIIEKALSHG